jgi:outer membrane lipoprotein-sorting protein
MTTRLWDRAAALPAHGGERSPQLVALESGLPDLAELFTFMRDAELRFRTLKMRIEERTFAARGELLTVMDVSLQHPGHARVVTSEPGKGAVAPSEIWLSDGETIRTYSTSHKLATQRPIRNRPRGLESRDLPGTSKVYEPLTPLPTETLADLFIHPAGYCQNVLATGECWISGTQDFAWGESIVVECDHPRSVEQFVDRPDYHIQIAVDRREGVITRLAETVRGELTRLATVVLLDPDAALQPSVFELELPEGTTTLY